jgi:hypothetical protein
MARCPPYLLPGSDECPGFETEEGSEQDLKLEDAGGNTVSASICRSAIKRSHLGVTILYPF